MSQEFSRFPLSLSLHRGCPYRLGMNNRPVASSHPIDMINMSGAVTCIRPIVHPISDRGKPKHSKKTCRSPTSVSPQLLTSEARVCSQDNQRRD